VAAECGYVSCDMFISDDDLQALATQKFREQKEEERRRRLEELRHREDSHRQQVEERKRQIDEAERDRREAIMRKNQVGHDGDPSPRIASAERVGGARSAQRRAPVHALPPLRRHRGPPTPRSASRTRKSCAACILRRFRIVVPLF